MQVTVKGAELFFSARGTGPVCLVPTAIGTGPYERQTAGALSEAFTMVYVDLRGSGRSTGTASDLDFDLLAEDLEAVRRDLGMDQVMVLGHSIVGVLAIEYGRRCPKTVSHVIAAGTPPFADMDRISARATAFFAEHASQQRKRLLQENLGGLSPGASPGEIMFAQTPMRFFDPRFDAPPLFADAVARPEVLEHLLGALTAGWEVTLAADSLQVPLLLAHGRHDYLVPYTLWEAVLSALPRATLQIFERSGHQPFFEEPQAFVAAVTAWRRAAGVGAGQS